LKSEREIAGDVTDARVTKGQMADTAVRLIEKPSKASANAVSRLYILATNEGLNAIPFDLPAPDPCNNINDLVVSSLDGQVLPGRKPTADFG
jgi:hypothetical protein